MISELPRLFKPRIVLNRAQCNRCSQTIVSRSRWDFVTCECGYLSVDGGREYLKRSCEDAKLASGEDFRAFTDLSIHTSIVSRRGLILHAYQPGDVAIHCTDAVGQQSVANPPTDWVVYEAEGGATAWTDEAFRAQHDFVPTPENR